MEVRKVGIVMNGVTGRMGTNQHLERSIVAIMKQGGVRVSDDLTLMPDPILTGRNEKKLEALSQRYGITRYTTDVQAALDAPDVEIFFDSSTTKLRAKFVEMAVEAGRAVYCEKPVGTSTDEAVRLYTLCRDAGLKNGVVQDKLWLPGIRKFLMLKKQGFFGEILSVRGEFGYWVFRGDVPDQPTQRPSWNYRAEEGGGIIVDMHCHWRYLVDRLFGNIRAVSCIAATHLPERVDERGRRYRCTAEDSVYATFELDNGIICDFNSSWDVRVRRDDLLTLQVDGTHGSAVVGLRNCWVQHLSQTPRVVWNPDLDSPINYYDNWTPVPDQTHYDNAFKAQWELFLRHVVLDEPFVWSLREGAKGVQLAELSHQSWTERRWVEVPELEC